jgi:hypothetical protein
MSIYGVNKVCWLANGDAAFRERLQTDAEGALAQFRLTEDEKRAILAGDVAALHTMGAHDYLLGHLQRWGLFGLTRESYQTKMRTLLPPELAAKAR